MVNGDFTNYCHWPENRYTESPLEATGFVLGLAAGKLATEKTKFEEIVFDEGYRFQPLIEQAFVGGDEEVTLRAILTRAEYRCECDGVLCKNHQGRCGVIHVSKGGPSPFLLQPKDIKKKHSLENSQAMCAACCTANTVSKMTVPKKKRKAKTDERQMSII
jgi:hypothetical protein